MGLAYERINRKWAVLICLIIIYCREAKAETELSEELDADAEVVDTSTSATSANEGGNWVANLDEKKCMMKKIGCCEQFRLDDEDNLAKCLALHQNKIPGKNDKDLGKAIKFLSCFVECYYKQVKYIGKGDNINMKMVRANAEKTYADRPKEKEHHIKMYEFCKKDALKLYGMVKSNPAGKVAMKDACKPYFLFVFLCTSQYHKKKECPYFVWEGKDNMKTECEDGKNRCLIIDGHAH